MTFLLIKAYLKDIHATLAMHNGERNKDGWKLVRVDQNTTFFIDDNANLDNLDDAWGAATHPSDKQHAWRKPPSNVKGVPRLKGDLEALSVLTDSGKPPEQLVRASRHAQVIYGFGDASGNGFGSAIEIEGGV